MDPPRPRPDCPFVVAYGLGVNSTAMLVEFAERDIVPDMILFADTGGEKPETYRYGVTARSRPEAAANVTTILAPEVPVSEPVLFDAFQIHLFVPAGLDDVVADAARAALDDPPFPELVRDAVTRLLGTAPALTVLTAVVE